MKSGTLFTLSGAGALFFLLLLVIRSANPPGLAHFPLSSTLVQLQAAAIAVIPFALGLALRRGHPLQPAQRQLSQGRARLLLTVAVGALPVVYVLLRHLLPENDYVIPLPFFNDRALFTSLVLMTIVTGCLAWLWWRGVWNSPVKLRLGALVLVIITVQLALTLHLHGRVPHPHDGDEYHVIATARRVYEEPARLLTSAPYRNVNTWFDNPATRVLAGAWMSVVGTGLLQGRFFWLLVAWLAVPFTYLVAQRLYGRIAGIAALALVGFVPLQYNLALSFNFVPTLLIIALWCRLCSRSPAAKRPRAFSFLCGFCAAIATEGHVYGVFFAVIFLVFYTAEFAGGLRRGEGWRQPGFWCFLAGCALAFLIWLAYHIALPGIALVELPELLRRTFAWESYVGVEKPPALSRLLSATLTQIWLNPFEPALMVLILFSLVRNRRKAITLLPTILVAGILLFFLVALITHGGPYLLLVFPVYCALFGAAVKQLQVCAPESRDNTVPVAALALLLSVPMLFALRNVEAARFPPTLARFEFLEAMGEIGSDIDALLPEEDVVVAGEYYFHAGMWQRLNFYDMFLFIDRTDSIPGFLNQDAKMWPLADPRALVLDEGRLEEYPQLDGWLVAQDFQLVRCYATPGYGTGTTMLWFHPELERPAGPSGCPDG